MKRLGRSWIVALVLLAAPVTCLAQGGFGIGIIVGEPTGVSAKIWLSHRHAIDLAAAWSFEGEDALHVHGDYVTHFYDLLDVSKGSLPLYVGIGGRIKFGEDDDFIGIRIPVGLAYLFEGAPVDVFLEVVPLLDVAPDTEFTLNAAIGVRYFFGAER